eukprot:1139512-Amorphochlora_amoeboformis.AAC.1
MGSGPCIGRGCANVGVLNRVGKVRLRMSALPGLLDRLYDVHSPAWHSQPDTRAGCHACSGARGGAYGRNWCGVGCACG